MNNQNNTTIEQENMEAALQQVEQEVGMEQYEANTGEKIHIKVKNSLNCAKTELDVYENNILQQVLDATAKDLGIDTTSHRPFAAKTIFLNDNNQSTADSDLTLYKFGLAEGSLLTIVPYAGVA